MRKSIILLVLLLVVSFSYAQDDQLTEGLLINDYFPVENDTEIVDTSLLKSETSNFYKNLNNWIPYCNAEPLTNAPITYINISFHVMLDSNGQNSKILDSPEGRAKLIQALNGLNDIYDGGTPPSDPIIGVNELPNYDTKIRFTLGQNNERIYFYKNTQANTTYSAVRSFVETNYPERIKGNLNIFLTASHYNGNVSESSFTIKSGGSGYTSKPTITFNPTGATATAIIENGVLIGMKIINGGSYSDIPIVTISGGGGTGAKIIINKLINGKIEPNIKIMSGGSGYTSQPLISFSPVGAQATAIIENGTIVGLKIIKKGEYNRFDPPTVTVSGGGGSGANIIISKLNGGASGLYNGPSIYIFYCDESDEFVNTLAHEIGHAFRLVHTYCGGFGNGNVVSCSLSPNKCSALFNDAEYLSDIFGTCPGNSPHICDYSNPNYSYNSDGTINTSINNPRHTNNVVGGSSSPRYISPMQAGIIYRSLAFDQIGEYVSKDTYSDIPLIISEDEKWDFKIRLFRDIIITNGATLTLKNYKFTNNTKIIVNNGSALIIDVPGEIWINDNNSIVVNSGGTLLIKNGSYIYIYIILVKLKLKMVDIFVLKMV